MNLSIFPPDEILEASVDLPLSKSMSARALIINRIGGFREEPELSDSDDTSILRAGLEKADGTFNAGAAGTAMRFLTAYYAATEGIEIILDGDERMRMRPLEPLVDALQQIGADIEYVDRYGYAPIRIAGKKLAGGTVLIDSGISSQFISAMMMVAPLMEKPLSLSFDSEPVSLSYIKMTGKMMTSAGVEPLFLYNRIDVPNIPYTRAIDKVERDWSSASYWYSIAALSAGWVTLNGMDMESIQGDCMMKEFGERLGVVTSESEDVDGALELSASPEQHSRINVDMSDTPDLVPTVAVAAAALGIPFRFTGVRTLKDKECDRLQALVTEALKLGLIFETEGDDVLLWDSKRVPVHEMPRISTYNDHRMAMAFAPLAVFLPGIVIENAEVVSKSYKDFWTHLEEAGFMLQNPDKTEEDD